MNPPIRILLVDDHTIVRQGLSRLLEEHPEFKVVGEAFDGYTAIDQVHKLKPNVVIMDISMPRMNGIEATRRLRKLFPEVKILILSMYSQKHYIHELFESGVSGYLLKDSCGQDIVAAIHAAMNNEAYLSPSISKVLVDSYGSPKTSSRMQLYKTLSNREREVLQMIAEGHSSRQVAEILCISISTVKSHRRSIMEKLDIDTVEKLILFTIQIGLVDPGI